MHYCSYLERPLLCKILLFYKNNLFFRFHYRRFRCAPRPNARCGWWIGEQLFHLRHWQRLEIFKNQVQIDRGNYRFMRLPAVKKAKKICQILCKILLFYKNNLFFRFHYRRFRCAPRPNARCGWWIGEQLFHLRHWQRLSGQCATRLWYPRAKGTQSGQLSVCIIFSVWIIFTIW